MLTVKNPEKFDWASITLPDCALGNAKDAYFTLKIFYELREKLKELKLDKIMEDLLCEVSLILARIEQQGMRIDKAQLDSLSKILKKKISDQEDFLYSLKQVEKGDNLNSSEDLTKILYTRESGFRLYPPDRTLKTGKPSTSAPTLKLIKELIDSELVKRKAHGKVEA